MSANFAWFASGLTSVILCICFKEWWILPINVAFCAYYAHKVWSGV
jgi:hypothetical protein